MKHYSFSDLCSTLGKETFYVSNLQRTLDLHVPPKKGTYSQAYLHFLEKLVALRTFSVQQERIQELFEIEKKILKLLHVDTLTDSPTWYLDACLSGFDRDAPRTNPRNRLLLTGYELGFPVTAEVVQDHLNFGGKDPELFEGKEMGEDVRLVLQKYLERVEGIRSTVRREKSVLENALFWADTTFW